MSDAIHHDSPEGVHYNLPDQRAKLHRAVSFGFTVICLVLLAVSAGLASKLKKQDIQLADLRAQVQRANSETATAQAGLAKAGEQSADLQSQLNQAKRSQVDLDAQIKKAAEERSALQAQLDKGRVDLQSQQEKARTETASLQAAVNQANTSSSGLRKELATAKEQVTDLQGQLAKAQNDLSRSTPKPIVAEARPLPLTTELKKAFLGGTYTLKINNPWHDTLKVDLDITGSPNPTARSATIEAGGTLEVKDLAAGARVAIASAGYAPMSVTVK